MRKTMSEMGEIISERDIPTTEGLTPVWVVLILAMGSGAVVFTGVGLLAWACRWPVRLALGASGGAILVVWLFLVLGIRELLVATEVTRQVASVPIAAPAEALPARVQIEITEPEAGRWRLVDLPDVTPAQLAELARGLALGRPFAEAEWCGRGRPFSKATFRTMRAELLERGILAPRHPRAPWQGFALTPAGRHIMERIADGTAFAGNRARARHVAEIAPDTGEEGRAE